MPLPALMLLCGFWEAIWWQNTSDLNKIMSKFFAKIHRGSLNVDIKVSIWAFIQE